jgi:hypothetical protein
MKERIITRQQAFENRYSVILQTHEWEEITPLPSPIVTEWSIEKYFKRLSPNLSNANLVRLDITWPVGWEVTQTPLTGGRVYIQHLIEKYDMLDLIFFTRVKDKNIHKLFKMMDSLPEKIMASNLEDELEKLW